ncbi:MAG: MFS transporter PPP family 3-phenylpropionic acid transporter [Rhodospirillaceae bacterium]|nr:MAG: MFS transporter PPP family 3-phenylpropionic acid transporter [Rhodospirillaceae bacterium]
MAFRFPVVLHRLIQLPVSLQLASYYGASFTVLGVLLPFWPVWLKAKGLSDPELSLVIGVGIGARVIANPLVAHLVDVSGRRTGTMAILAVLSVALCALFTVIEGFWSLLLLSGLWMGVFTAILPLGESLTLLTAYSRHLDYGRIRLWGSLSFIMVAVTSGTVLTGHAPTMFLWLLMAGTVLTLLACLLLEDLPPPARGRADPAAFRRVMADSRCWLFLAAASLVSASHNLYYGFATLHWQHAGLSPLVIGGLWAEAVAAEVLLFAFSSPIVTWLQPTGLMILGSGAAVVR